MNAHVEDCIFITLRILTSHKNGKQFCIMSFLHDGVLYSDVFLDEKFIPVLTCLTYNDKFSIDFIIQRFNGNWKVSVDSITI